MLSLWPLHSGSSSCVGEAPKLEEQAGEQTGEHWSEEDTHGTPAGGAGTGTGSRILKRKRCNKVCRDREGGGVGRGVVGVGFHGREVEGEIVVKWGKERINKETAGREEEQKIEI